MSGFQQPLLTRYSSGLVPQGTRRFEHKHNDDNDGDGGDADGWVRCLAGVADWLTDWVAGCVAKRKGRRRRRRHRHIHIHSVGGPPGTACKECFPCI